MRSEPRRGVANCGPEPDTGLLIDNMSLISVAICAAGEFLAATGDASTGFWPQLATPRRVGSQEVPS